MFLMWRSFREHAKYQSTLHRRASESGLSVLRLAVGGAFEISADDFLGRLAVVRVVGAGYITEYLHNHHILNTLNT